MVASSPACAAPIQRFADQSHRKSQPVTAMSATPKPPSETPDTPRAVPPGTPFPFADHRTLAEVIAAGEPPFAERLSFRIPKPRRD